MMITVAMKPITILVPIWRKFKKGRNGGGSLASNSRETVKKCKESVNENQGRRRVIPARDWD